MLLSAAQSTLLVVDVQARLAPAVSDPEACIQRIKVLIQAAQRLAVPVLASEQYPKGLGHTVDEIADLVPQAQRCAKTSFSCANDPGLLERLRQLGRAQIVLCGMEAHVCVLQSALGLRERGFVPAVVADAVASRTPANHELALARLRENGIEVVSSEMVVFEWLHDAASAEFKALARLIK